MHQPIVDYIIVPSLVAIILILLMICRFFWKALLVAAKESLEMEEKLEKARRILSKFNINDPVKINKI